MIELTDEKLKLSLAGVAVGFVYGVALRLMYQVFPHALENSWVMTFSFIVLMPFAMGVVTVYVAELKERQRILTWIFLPWFPVIAALLAMMLLLLEGLICVVLFAPLALVLATLGGVLGGVSGRFIRSHRAKTASLACVLVLPFLVMPWENQVLNTRDLRTVENTIDIQAPAAVIWRNIERVPAIRTDELPSSWSHRIGFPNPVEATLSHEGVGGVRNATFTGGVLFLETIDVWEPEHRLSFTIRAQTDQIPATTLDEHVHVGGPYFDVLRGEYRLEPLPNGTVRLHLLSRHRLSTDFNWYSHLWTDAIMSDLQKRILHVIKNRCER